MRYDVIFKDVAENLSKNYAGKEEKERRHDPFFFSANCQRAQKQGKLDEKQFLQIMKEYLVSLGDRNLSFSMKESSDYQKRDPGFDVRNYRGHLYVTQVREEKRLTPGDEIYAIDMVMPNVIKNNMEKNYLGEELEERELWGPVLETAKKVTVKRKNGTYTNFSLKGFPVKEKLPKLGGKLMGKDTLYLNLPHFAEEEVLEKLLASKEKSLTHCKKLILDLRHHMGGTETVFYPLLDYIFPEPVLVRDLYEETGLYTNYTEENCRRKIQMFESYLPQSDPQTKRLVLTMIEELKEKSGKGLLWEEDEELTEDETMVGGKGAFEQVIILSDTYCEYAGETFIQLCKKSPIVKVIGRPTMGNIDYCNPISICYDNLFTFTYPMSKSRAAAEGRGISGKGVPVDVYVPFTPLECVQDVLLERAKRF